MNAEDRKANRDCVRVLNAFLRRGEPLNPVRTDRDRAILESMREAERLADADLRELKTEIADVAADDERRIHDGIAAEFENACGTNVVPADVLRVELDEVRRQRDALAMMLNLALVCVIDDDIDDEEDRAGITTARGAMLAHDNLRLGAFLDTLEPDLSRKLRKAWFLRRAPAVWNAITKPCHSEEEPER